MTQEKKQTLIKYLLMKVEVQDWHAVSDAANDLREVEIELRMGVRTSIKDEGIVPAISTAASSDVLPTDIEIPHNIQEVRSILRMKDEDLIEKLFPLDEASDNAN